MHLFVRDRDDDMPVTRYVLVDRPKGIVQPFDVLRVGADHNVADGALLGMLSDQSVNLVRGLLRPSSCALVPLHPNEMLRHSLPLFLVVLNLVSVV